MIEVLVVLFIISVVTAVALMTISHNRNRSLQQFANNFAQVLTLAQEQAILQPAIIGLIITPNSFYFVAYIASEDGKTKQWVDMDDKILTRHTIPNDIRVTFNVGKTMIESTEKESADEDEDENANEIQHPQIIISTNGDMTPFSIYIGMSEKPPRYLIKGTTDGDISFNSLN